MTTPAERREILRQLGPNTLQQLVIRRYHKTVRVVLPDYDTDALVWYFYPNDTFNASVLDRSSVSNAESEVAGSLLIRKDPLTQQIVYVMIYEVSNWLYGHHLSELCDLPGLPPELMQAIAAITEEQLPHHYSEDQHE